MNYSLCLAAFLAFSMSLSAQTSYENFCSKFPHIAKNKNVEYVPMIPGVRDEGIVLKNRMTISTPLTFGVLGGLFCGVPFLRNDGKTPAARTMLTIGGLCFGAIGLILLAAAIESAYTIGEPYSALRFGKQGIFDSDNECVVSWKNLKTVTRVEHYQDGWHTGTELVFQDGQNKQLWSTHVGSDLPITLPELLELMEYFRAKYS